MPLNIEDLVPKETTFTLGRGDTARSLILAPWSLRVRSWAQKKYGPAELKNIFEKQKIEEIAEIAFFMLKEPKPFETLDAFMDAVQSPRDQLNLIKGLLGAVGIGEPEMEKITKAVEDEGAKETPAEKLDPNDQSPNP